MVIKHGAVGVLQRRTHLYKVLPMKAEHDMSKQCFESAELCEALHKNMIFTSMEMKREMCDQVIKF